MSEWSPVLTHSFTTKLPFFRPWSTSVIILSIFSAAANIKSSIYMESCTAFLAIPDVINLSPQSAIAACAVAPPRTSPNETASKHASRQALVSTPMPSGLMNILLKLASLGPEEILW